MLFLYAVISGIVDAITRRPDLPKRLAQVRYQQALRMLHRSRAEYALAMEAAQQVVSQASRDVISAHRAYRRAERRYKWQIWWAKLRRYVSRSKIVLQARHLWRSKR